MSRKPRDTRVEKDSLGEIEVPADRYWGAATQRSLKHFSIGTDLIPREVIHALAVVKKASALANRDLGVLPPDKADLIVRAAEEVMEGRLGENFPLRVWMTGSGTQANMNVNEVIANRAIELCGGNMGQKHPIHPNDHVNLSQSTNDAFPTAMNIAAALEIKGRLTPEVEGLKEALEKKAREWMNIVKIGRTHLQDAVPMFLGDEISGYAEMLSQFSGRTPSVMNGLLDLAIGGTMVGTGLLAPPGFGDRAAAYISGITGLSFRSARNKFAVMGAHDAMAATMAHIKTLAVSLYKIANDIRFLSCGPRAGIAELTLPMNEPGSSIMPGKANPTQCEAMSMAAVQVMGYDAAVAMACAGGDLEMNVYKPMIIFNIIQSIRLLSDASANFREFLVRGMTPNLSRISSFVESSLMLVTALSARIGYDKAARIALFAHEKGIGLKKAALELGFVSEEEFDAMVDPRAMARPH
ncbi:MAG: class II fumarate hydratase [Thermodesulfobacteriota bacterium]